MDGLAAVPNASETHPTVEPSDEALFLRYRDGGEGRALEALVRRHARGARRFAEGLLRDAHEAEDVAQEAFLRLVGAARAAFDPARGRFQAFFFRLVRNLALDRLRARREGAIVPDRALSAPASANGALRAERGEGERRLNELLFRLPDGERASIVLREFEGLSYREIAEVLGSSVDCVKVWIFRARKKLSSGLLVPEGPAPASKAVSHEL